MKTHHPAFAAATAAALLLPAVAHAAVINVTSVTYDDNGTSTAVSAGTTNVTFDNTLKLESFTDGNTTWDEFVLVDSVSDLGSTTYEFGENSTSDPGSVTEAVTDDRIDSWVKDVDDNSQYFFEAAPVSTDDVLFFFEFTGGKTATVQLIDSDGDQVGTSTVSFGDAEGIFGKLDPTDFSTFNITLQAVEFSDFGVTSGNIGDVAGIEITSTSTFDDPMLIGHTGIPEPASLALVGVGSLLILTGRRRDA